MPDTRSKPLVRFTDSAGNGAGLVAERDGGLARLTPLTPEAEFCPRANVDGRASWAIGTLVLDRRYPRSL